MKRCYYYFFCKGTGRRNLPPREDRNYRGVPADPRGCTHGRSVLHSERIESKKRIRVDRECSSSLYSLKSAFLSQALIIAPMSPQTPARSSGIRFECPLLILSMRSAISMGQMMVRGPQGTGSESFSRECSHLGAARSPQIAVCSFVGAESCLPVNAIFRPP
jgi:hypothetical protein